MQSFPARQTPVEGGEHLFPKGRGHAACQLSACVCGKRGEQSVVRGVELFHGQHENETVGEAQIERGHESVFQNAETVLLAVAEAETGFGERGLVLVKLTSAYAEVASQRLKRTTGILADGLHDAQQSGNS